MKPEIDKIPNFFNTIGHIDATITRPKKQKGRNCLTQFRLPEQFLRCIFRKQSIFILFI